MSDDKNLKARIANLNNRVSKAVGAIDHGPMANFVATLLGCTVSTHLQHFTTASRSDHLALEQFYEAIPDLVDGLAESYQGKFGKIVGVYPSATPITADNALEYLLHIEAYVEQARQTLPQLSWIQNQIDEIAKLTNQVIYQLRELS